MKLCKSCGITKPASEFHARRDRPGGLKPACKICAAKKAAEYREKNLEAVQTRSKDWHFKNRERSIETTRAWQKANRQAHAERAAAYREANSAKLSAEFKRWAADNKHATRANRAKRRAALKKAIPPWSDKEAIKVIYAEAARLSAETGIEHHVDHIVPLQHSDVCGLHVQFNLRVIPKRDNQKKYNKWDPAQPLPSRAPDKYAAVGQ